MFTDDKFSDVTSTPKLAEYTLERFRLRRCKVCLGVGHQAYQCTTKKRLDKHAKAMDTTCEWGDVKSQIMMDNYNKFSFQYRLTMQEKAKKYVQCITYGNGS